MSPIGPNWAPCQPAWSACQPTARRGALSCRPACPLLSQPPERALSCWLARPPPSQPPERKHFRAFQSASRRAIFRAGPPASHSAQCQKGAPTCRPVCQPPSQLPAYVYLRRFKHVHAYIYSAYVYIYICIFTYRAFSVLALPRLFAQAISVPWCTADLSAVWHSGHVHVGRVAQRTCLMCDTTDQSAAWHVCGVAQRTCLLGGTLDRSGARCGRPVV